MCVCACACTHTKSLQLCLTVCDPMDYSPSGFSVHGILYARILEWMPCPPPGDLPDSGITPTSLISPVLAGGFFTTSTTWEAPVIPFQLTNYSCFISFGQEPSTAFKAKGITKPLSESLIPGTHSCSKYCTSHM